MDYSRFLNPVKDGDLVYLLRKIHEAAEETPDAFSLASGAPNPDTVPIARTVFYTVDGTALEVNEEETREAMKYQTAQGMDKLLDWIQAIHEKYHNPPILNHSNPDSKFTACVTAGSAMGAMHLTFSQVIQKNDVVLTDDFIFGGAICCFKRARAVMLGVTSDQHGILPESFRYAIENWKDLLIENGVDVERNLKAPKLLYTNPTGQNPTGIVVSLERKKQIYEIAREYNLLIIEDDPYFFLQYNGTLVPSYQSIDEDGRVIRIDSMSKFISPGIRAGWLSGPAKIVTRVASAQTTACISSSCLAQLVTIKLFDYWGQDGIAKRIEYLQQFYKAYRDAAEKAVRDHLSELVEWNSTEAGFFMWLKLKSGKNTLFLADTDLSKKYGTFAVPGIDFSCFTHDGPFIRIAFSYVPKEKLGLAAQRLAKFIKEVTEQ